MSNCQIHIDRPRHCPCFALCTECAAGHSTGCKCAQIKAIALEKERRCKPKEPVPVAAVGKPAIPDDSQILKLFEINRSQELELTIRRKQFNQLQAAYEAIMDLQKKRLADIESVKPPSAGQQKLDSIVKAIQQKPETTGVDYKTEIESLKQLVMDSPADEEVKRAILDRTERLSDLKKESLKPSRLEQLAKPKVHGKPINKSAKKA